jgi:hypothetical protein
MPNSLETLLDSLIRTRIHFTQKELSKNNLSYNQLFSEYNLYHSRMHEQLPDDLHHDLFLYEDAATSLRLILEREIYLQGFKDALCLHNEVQAQP